MAQSSHCSISISQGHKAFSSQPFEVSNSLLCSLSQFRSHSPSPAAGPPLISELTAQALTLSSDLLAPPLFGSIAVARRRSRPSPIASFWRHIPDKQPHDLHHQPTENVFCSVIDPKHANQIVSCLNQIAPLENLRHVKRIQKKNLEGGQIQLSEMYKQAGSQFRDELQCHNLPSYLVKDINARLEGIQPKVRSSDGNSSGYNAGEIKPLNVHPKKSSPKAKGSSRVTSLFGASLLGQFHKFSMRNYWNSNFDYLMGSQKLLQLVSDSSKASNTSTDKKEIKDNKDSKSESHCSNEPHWPSGILNNG
ncbi:hypothetical protein RIF29_30147 [Crotalaria pallida]|uniref:Uncharacterized protein n=1 Tax=Crotalaria pallida TaxID=3830 RepID=A0AAN9HY30_CROPI